MQIPEEVRVLIDGKLKLGQQTKIVHLLRQDGSNCSKGKDAALSVKRIMKGVVFHCHRCGMEGFIGNDKLSPQTIKYMLHNLKMKPEVILPVMDLPPDFVPMRGDYKDDDVIPFPAYGWLWKSGVTDEMMESYNIGWSPKFKRVILPVVDKVGELQGYIGRDVYAPDKAARKAMGVPKYITRKRNEDRLFFEVFKAQPDAPTIIVEDVLSAIRIYEATGCGAMALLNTHIPMGELMKRGHEEKFLVWLDGDQLGNMINFCSRARTYGIKCGHVRTTKDPKGYNEFFIWQIIKQAVSTNGWGYLPRNKKKEV